MTQATPIIGASQSGLQYRNADNDGKKAMLNHHKGSSAPTYAEAGIIWLDDIATPWLLKIHDGTDWIVLGEVNATTNAFNASVIATATRLLNHAADTGSANAYAVAPSPAITAYAAGQIVILKPANGSTGAATINVNSLGVKNIKLLSGADTASGALLTTGIYQLVYDGTNFVLLNPSLGSAAYLNAGTAANNLVQLDGTAKLPAVDGSQLTNLSGGAGLTVIASGNLATGSPTAVDITSIPATYRELVLYISGASNSVATRALRVDVDTGNGLGSANNSTCYTFANVSVVGTVNNATNRLHTDITLTAAQEEMLVVNFPAYQSGPIKRYTARYSVGGTGSDWGAGTPAFVDGILTTGAGNAARTGAIAGIRLTWNDVSSGVFDGGTYTLYGVK